MPCEILIAAVGKIGVTQKGYPWIIKDCPCTWGKKESPPNWVVLRLTDASKAQVEHFLRGWRKSFQHEIIAETDQGYRIKISVDPALVSATNMNKEIRSNMKDYIVDVWNATIHSYSGYEVVVDIPKPVDVKELKDDILDKFDEYVDFRLYYFPSEDVDLALANDGFMEITKQQALNRIKCKLDE